VFAVLGLVVHCRRIHKPGPLDVAKLFWSNYKQAYTVKVLVGVTPAGVIAYVSDFFPGRVTDDVLTARCGLLDVVRVRVPAVE